MKRLFVILFPVFLCLLCEAQTVTDYDGNIYDTVVIGTQVWLKQNLRTTHDNLGNPIPNITDSAYWASQLTMARCYYNNDSAAYDAVYGPLYNWYVISNGDICPVGWHVSTDAEWLAAEMYLGGVSVAGGKMKEAGTTHWSSPNVGATNSSGFTGLPGGMRNSTSVYSTLYENALYWTATSYSGTMAWSTYLWYQFAGVDHNPAPKKYGMSIRCIRNSNAGIEETKFPGLIRLSPNPVQNILTIENPANEDLILRVFTTDGRLVAQKELASGTCKIDVSTLLPGVYLVSVTGVSFRLHLKVLKE